VIQAKTARDLGNAKNSTETLPKRLIPNFPLGGILLKHALPNL
jgi:hypothetical protein